MTTPAHNLDPMIQAICDALRPFPREQHQNALETTVKLYMEADELFAQLSRHDGRPPLFQELGAA